MLSFHRPLCCNDTSIMKGLATYSVDVDLSLICRSFLSSSHKTCGGSSAAEIITEGPSTE